MVKCSPAFPKGIFSLLSMAKPPKFSKVQKITENKIPRAMVQLTFHSHAIKKESARFIMQVLRFQRDGHTQP